MRHNGSPQAAAKPGGAEVRAANRLRQLRLDQGLTLKALAEKAGISDAFISRVENHKASIPIASLERLANALNVTIADLFEQDKRTVPITICRSNRGTQGRLRGPNGVTYRLLAGEKHGKLMEPLRVDVTAESCPLALSHPGEQFDYVLEGECELIYGKEHIRMRQGDAAYYDATVPHTRRPIDGKSCRLLIVVASRDYLFHGDLRQLLGKAVS
jgi:transcriptional regulator with XRE-family HTH domain